MTSGKSSLASNDSFPLHARLWNLKRHLFLPNNGQLLLQEERLFLFFTSLANRKFIARWRWFMRGWWDWVIIPLLVWPTFQASDRNAFQTVSVVCFSVKKINTKKLNQALNWFLCTISCFIQMSCLNVFFNLHNPMQWLWRGNEMDFGFITFLIVCNYIQKNIYKLD